MNANVSLTARKLKWLAPVLALVLLAGVAYTAERLRIPEDMLLPFYALGLGHSGESAEDWIVTAFCYPPDSFKANYDLFKQPVDPSLLPDQPGYMEGFAVVAGGPYPMQAMFRTSPVCRCRSGSPGVSLERHMDGLPDAEAGFTAWLGRFL